MMLEEYMKLISDFVEGRLPVAEFEWKYLDVYKTDVDTPDNRAQDILWQLFTDVDAYSPSCQPGEETPFRISEESLRRQARSALRALQRLANFRSPASTSGRRHGDDQSGAGHGELSREDDAHRSDESLPL